MLSLKVHTPATVKSRCDGYKALTGNTLSISLNTTEPIHRQICQRRHHIYTSLSKNSGKTENLVQQLSEKQASKIPIFKNNIIAEKVIEQLIAARLQDPDYAIEHKSKKYFEGLVPQFKVKRKKNIFRKIQNAQSEEKDYSKLEQKVNNITLDILHSSLPIKTTMRSSFYRNYKQSMQRKKSVEHRIPLNKRQQSEYEALIHRIQKTALLGQYSIKKSKQLNIFNQIKY